MKTIPESLVFPFCLLEVLLHPLNLKCFWEKWFVKYISYPLQTDLSLYGFVEPQFNCRTVQLTTIQ